MGGEHPEHRDCGTYLYEPFQHLPYAPAKSFHWIAAEDEYTQVCGFLPRPAVNEKGDMNERVENDS